MIVFGTCSQLDFSCQFNYGCSEVYPFASILPGAPMSFHEETISNISLNPLNKYTVSLFFLSKLHTLKLSYVPIEVTLPSFCWAGNHLVNLDLSHTRKIKTAGILDCIYFLRYLNLRHVASLTLSIEVFHGMPSLEVLMLGSSGIKTDIFSSKNATKLFEKNEYLKFLDLSDLGLTSLPKKFFYHQHQLKTLILSQNKFTTVEFLQINFTSIHYLDLSSNSMFDIPVAIINQLEKGMYANGHRKSLNMTNNPFMCVCSSISQIYTVLHSRVGILGAEPNGSLKCSLKDKASVSFPEAKIILNKRCKKLDKVSIVFITFVYPLVLLILLTSSCSYRHRWSIQYAWYKTINLVRIKEAELLKDNFIFDAFVAHSQQDEEWVRTGLIRKLERGKKPYSCCIHYRNFLPGEFIADNIVSAIKMSKKTILVVTKTFVRSGWCDFESRAAQSHHLGKTRGGIIAIVFPGGYEAAKRKPGLAGLLDCVTFLPWSEDKEEQNVFWLKLRMALGKPAEVTERKRNADIKL